MEGRKRVGRRASGRFLNSRRAARNGGVGDPLTPGLIDRSLVPLQTTTIHRPTEPRAMTTRVSSATVAVLLVCSIGLPLGGQDRPADRRRFLDTAATRTTDDPRRTPIPRERRTGPEQVIVVRNGRVFDGTGAAAREGTLVITGNRITAILPPNAPATWPRDARVIDATAKTV